MTMRFLTGLLLISAAAPVSAAGQGLGLAGRVGTLGLGAEVALDVSDRVVLRGGFGVTPYEPTFGISDIDVGVDFPTVYNVGLDLYLNSVVRVGGGLLFRSGEVGFTGDFDDPQEIGGTIFTPQEVGTLTGELGSRSRAAYLLIGVGRHTAYGAGLFLDLGFAFTGEPDVLLGAEGGTLSPDTDPTLRNALDQEARDFENDMPGFLKIWPILSIGIRFGAY